VGKQLRGIVSWSDTQVVATVPSAVSGLAYGISEIPPGASSVWRLEQTTWWLGGGRDVPLEPVLVGTALLYCALATRAVSNDRFSSCQENFKREWKSRKRKIAS
jgi:hypothetical protein